MLNIETATYDDIEDIKSLLDSAEVPSDEVDPDFTTYFIVRDESSKIIACIGLELFTGTALLTSFAVDPDHRGEGLGTNLVDKLLEEAFKAGSETVYLCTAKAPELFQPFKGSPQSLAGLSLMMTPSRFPLMTPSRFPLMTPSSPRLQLLQH